MKIVCLLGLFILVISPSFSQGEYTSRDHPISISYPEHWTINNNDHEAVVSLIYKLDLDGKMRLAAGFAIVAEPAKFGDDLEGMSLAYRKGLYSRKDMEKEKILTEEIIDFHGIKAIDITGQATIPIVKQNAKWRIILLEYGDYYYEISATSTKKDMKNKEIKNGFNYIIDSIKFK